MKNQLHPGARWVYRLRSYSTLIFLFFFLGSIIFSPISYFFSGGSFGLNLIFNIIFSIIAVVIIGEIYSRMSYNRYLYEFDQQGLKIEKGIIWKKYTSIPYERIQNVDIKRGILARMFGFSTVDVETAGQAGFGGYGVRFGRRRQRYESEGHLMAIDLEGAEEIREFVLKKIRLTHDSGL